MWTREDQNLTNTRDQISQILDEIWRHALGCQCKPETTEKLNGVAAALDAIAAELERK